MSANSSIRKTKEELGKTSRNPFAKSKTQKVLSKAEKDMTADEFKRFSNDFQKEEAAVRKRQMIILTIAAAAMVVVALLILKRLFN